MADSKTLTKRDIEVGLRKSGLARNDHVIVHSALSSFGRLARGADTVIDALLSVVGPEGTVVVPTFGGSDKVFDAKKTATDLGAIPDAFWRRPDAIRSRHPLASVAAIGAQAEWLIADHPRAKTAHGVGTPYHKLAQINGKVLLLGVDQDRNTFLHTAEALARGAYLSTERGDYLDNKRHTKQGRWQHFPGPHRNFIGLQACLETHGLVAKTKIGNCVAQLMPMAEVLEALLARLTDQPDLFISENPNLPDGIRQRAAVYRARLRRMSFTTVADTQYAGATIEPIIDNVRRWGIDHVLLSYINQTAWAAIDDAKRKWYLRGLRQEKLKVWGLRLPHLVAKKALDLLAECGAQALIVPTTVSLTEAAAVARKGYHVYLANVSLTSTQTVALMTQAQQKHRSLRLAFNPAQFVHVGENPFLTTYGTKVRRSIGALFINDALAPGEPTQLEEGLGEIKELISILRAQSFAGPFILQGPHPDQFNQTAQKFWDMLKELGR